MVEKQHLRVARLDDAEHQEHHHRQQAHDHPTHPGLRGECADLREQPLAGAHDVGQPRDDLCQRTAYCGLHLDRDHEQPQIVLGYPRQHVGQRLGDRQPKARLLNHSAELATQRVGELLLDHLHPTLQRVAGFQ